jgi:hypothetical protein
MVASTPRSGSIRAVLAVGHADRCRVRQLVSNSS